jgi:pyruvate/2-oxoglutarate dehydrogenase complex dihydrolipoamide acyltransferase (E2) component
MSEFLSETEGCDLLARLFRARGYAIARNLLFREYGVEFHIDGWDAKKRVGFEFLSSEDDDHDDLNLSEYQTLASAQQRGELALFIIDEVEPLSAADLALQANEFLDEVADALRMRRNAGPARKRAALKKKPAAGKAVAGKTKKSVVTKSVVTKSVATKSVATKSVATKKATAKKKPAATKARAGKKSATKRPAAGVNKSAGKKTAKKKAARSR